MAFPDSPCRRPMVNSLVAVSCKPYTKFMQYFVIILFIALYVNDFFDVHGIYSAPPFSQGNTAY